MADMAIVTHLLLLQAQFLLSTMVIVIVMTTTTTMIIHTHTHMPSTITVMRILIRIHILPLSRPLLVPMVTPIPTPSRIPRPTHTLILTVHMNIVTLTRIPQTTPLIPTAIPTHHQHLPARVYTRVTNPLRLKSNRHLTCTSILRTRVCRRRTRCPSHLSRPTTSSDMTTTSRRTIRPVMRRTSMTTATYLTTTKGTATTCGGCSSTSWR